MKDPIEMTGAQINKELDALDAKGSVLCDDMIAAWRGFEKPTETLAKRDPLSIRFRELYERRVALRIEIQERYGANAPRRLPPRIGSKPRRKPC